MNKNTWTQQQIDKLIELYPDISNAKDLVPVIGKSIYCLYAKARELGLKRSINPGHKNTGKRMWSQAELDKLIEFYPNATYASDLEAIIAKPLRSIYNKANAIGLKRNKNMGHLMLAKVGAAHRFTTGHTPINKGTKGLTGANSGSFKKGNLPKNYKHNGAYIANFNKGRYWVIQELGTGKRKSYVRKIWEEVNGPIPKGMVVAFKNGFVEDRVPVLDDLKLISYVENLRNNTGYDVVDERYAKRNLEKSKIFNPYPELIVLKQNQIKLNRLIKNKEHEGNTIND